MACGVDAIAELGGGLARIGGTRDAAGHIDEQALAIRPQAGRQGSLQVATLRADTGHQEPEIGHQLADLGQRLGIVGPDDDANIAAGVPFSGQASHVAVERTG